MTPTVKKESAETFRQIVEILRAKDQHLAGKLLTIYQLASNELDENYDGRSPHMKRVKKFMDTIEEQVPEEKKGMQVCPDEITEPKNEIKELRTGLALEEFFEMYSKGFGVDVYCEFDLPQLNTTVNINLSDVFREVDGAFTFKTKRPFNIVEVADGAADVSVINVGSMLVCGIKDDELLEEVDRSNLAKFGPDSYMREDGKWMKPADWEAPDIEGVLRKEDEITIRITKFNNESKAEGD